MAKSTTVIMRTSAGNIKIELYDNQAPETVKNFLTYVDESFYNGTIFHRVIDGFMIQGGGFTADLKQKKTHPPIRNEAAHKLPNARGTIAMARTSDIHSATAQFFINTVDNPFLNFQQPSVAGYGYCVFGKVVEGMDVIDKIQRVPTGPAKGMNDVPVQAVTIYEVSRESK